MISVELASRPRWPDLAIPRSRWMSIPHAAWSGLGALYCSAAMLSAFILRQVSVPIDAAFRPLLRSQVPQARTAWSVGFASAFACLACSLALPDRLEGSASIFETALLLTAAFLSLGLYRWSSIALMRSESSYESYPVMIDALSRGVTGWFLRRMRRPEDAVWVRHTAFSTLIHLPPTLALALWGSTSWFALLWFALAMLGTVKTAGANHNIGHAQPFLRLGRTRLDRWAGRAVSFWYHHVVEFLEGDIPHLTISGHNLIHHVENNGPEDYETSYPYDRTSFVSSSLLYFNCALSYSFGAYILPYLWQRRGKRPYRVAWRKSVLGLFYSYGLIAALAYFVGLHIALFVLAVRLLQSGLRYGTFAYSSHPFVDPDDPTNSFTNSIEAGTRGTLLLGGGQHAIHHWRPGRHWSRLQSDRKDIEEHYAGNGAVVVPLELIPFVQPLLFAKQFSELSRWVLEPADVVAYEQDYRGQDWSPREVREHVARRLERRARPGNWKPPGRLVSTLDFVASELLLWSTGARSMIRKASNDS